jgi:AraC-like DNA-binding protein
MNIFSASQPQFAWPPFQALQFENSALRRLVRSAWAQAYGASEAPLPGLIAPDAMIEIVFQLGAPCDLITDGRRRASPPAMVYGLRHGALRLQPTGDNAMVALRLAPAVASVVLRSGLSQCWDCPVPLSDFIGPAADDLLGRLSEGGSSAAAAVLEAWLAERLSDWGAEETRQLALQAALLWDFPDRPVHRLADRLGLTERTLRRRCATFAGLSPKQLTMSGRMLRACDLLRAQGRMPLAEVAGRVGFNDQPAFTNAFRRYFGMTPTALRDQPIVHYERRD